MKIAGDSKHKKMIVSYIPSTGTSALSSFLDTFTFWFKACRYNIGNPTIHCDDPDNLVVVCYPGSPCETYAGEYTTTSANLIGRTGVTYGRFFGGDGDDQVENAGYLVKNISGGKVIDYLGGGNYAELSNEWRIMELTGTGY